jgi:hypothetical protein
VYKCAAVYKYNALKSKAYGDKIVEQKFYVLLTAHLVIIFVNNQLDAQFFFMYVYFYSLYMFQAAMCPSSGEFKVCGILYALFE